MTSRDVMDLSVELFVLDIPDSLRQVWFARIVCARARAEELVCIAYEDQSLNPSTIKGIAVREPLKSWLSDRCPSASI
ncbi:MAG: hypothetical protein P1S60_00195 [Anaerolineae bacterium]|nr:hypothetical protein [Anaerolineae bacterium]